MKMHERVLLLRRAKPKADWGSFLVAFAAAVFAFCLCFAAAIHTNVAEAKAKPFELDIIAQGKAGFSQKEIAIIVQMEGVSNATAMVPLPVTLASGKYKAETASHLHRSGIR